MDGWQTFQNWALFSVAASGLVWYYHTTTKKPELRRDSRQHKRERNVEPTAAKAKEPHSHATGKHEEQTPKAAAKRRTEAAPTIPSPPTISEPQRETSDKDADDRFAREMARVREGTDLKRTESNEKRVRTVKQNSALNTPILSPSSLRANTDTEDDVSPVLSPMLSASGVSDMLEPVAPGPSSLRITASQKPEKQKMEKQAKKEVVETKKQRQNRQKVEEKKVKREAEEKERKALEETQRRSAREARGEPAKNGIPIQPAPVKNPWSASHVAAPSKEPAMEHFDNHSAPFLDTFDVDSNSSSNAGLSTAATSITEGGPTPWADDLPSEEEQTAMLTQESKGWNEVKSLRKQRKKPMNGDSKPLVTPNGDALSKTPLAAAKPALNGRPTGFQALGDEYEQRGDADPSDASNWDA